MEKIYEIVFSPTGRSKKVAGYIAENFKGKKILLDLCKASTERISVDNDSLCIFLHLVMGDEYP